MGGLPFSQQIQRKSGGGEGQEEVGGESMGKKGGETAIQI